MHRRIRLLALILIVTCTASAQAQEAEVREITGAELQERIEAGTAPVILDVRTAEEFAEGHIPGAINISHDELADRLDEIGIDLDEELVVHCRSGRRAGVAEELLGQHGYTQLVDLSGHFLQWVDEGRPVEH